MCETSCEPRSSPRLVFLTPGSVHLAEEEDESSWKKSVTKIIDQQIFIKCLRYTERQKTIHLLKALTAYWGMVQNRNSLRERKH